MTADAQMTLLWLWAARWGGASLRNIVVCTIITVIFIPNTITRCLPTYWLSSMTLLFVITRGDIILVLLLGVINKFWLPDICQENKICVGASLTINDVSEKLSLPVFQVKQRLHHKLAQFLELHRPTYRVNVVCKSCSSGKRPRCGNFKFSQLITNRSPRTCFVLDIK